jgi:hypothetical protein
LARGPILAQRLSLSGLVAYGRCQAERPGWPMAGNGATRGAASARSPRSRPTRWRGRRWLIGARGGARLAAQARGSLRPSARQGVRRGSSPECHAGGEGVKLGWAVAHVDAGRRGGDPGEVLRLGVGYAVIRAKPTRKRKRGCGAHRGGKRRRRFSANPARAATLLCSRPMHGLCGEGRKGCR